MTDALSLLEAIERLHPEPYRNVAPGVLRRQAERAADVPGTQRDRGIVELMRLAALLGERNGHTGISPWREHPKPFEAFPVRAYEFDEGTFAVAAVDPSLVGCELVAIAGIPLPEVTAAVSPLIPHDNEWTVRERRPRFLVVAEVLRGLGLVEADDPVIWRVRSSSGERELALETLPIDECRRLLDPPRPPRSIETLDEGRVLHVAYNVTLGETSRFAAEIVSRARRAEAVVLDLRHNAGGNNQTYGPLLAALERLTAAGKRLAVLTSRVTFSAAMQLVVDLEQRTPAVFVGEPTGASPNHYGDPEAVVLPHTQVSARVATISWTTAGAADTRTTREPDVFIPLSAAAFFSGADPVLGGALEQLAAG
ncbi:MAG TPA: hypothetical protein VJ716_08480 [Gaiellaceae bacterium]|nr:hypothetical protein [Gaiellaceae bacterium]